MNPEIYGGQNEQPPAHVRPIEEVDMDDSDYIIPGPFPAESPALEPFNENSELVIHMKSTTLANGAELFIPRD